MICLVTYEDLCKNQPIHVYLKEMLKPPNRTRDLRSSDQNLLFVSRIRTKMGEGCFSVGAPDLWHRLPCEIRISKTVQSYRKKNYLSFFDLVLLCPGRFSWYAE